MKKCCWMQQVPLRNWSGEELEQQLNYGKEAMDVLVKDNLVMEKKLAELRKGRAPCAG